MRHHLKGALLSIHDDALRLGPVIIIIVNDRLFALCTVSSQ